MKTIAAIMLTLWLAGCSMLPATYDNNEYLLLAQLEANTVMINKGCDDNAFVESRIPELEKETTIELHTISEDNLPSDISTEQVLKLMLMIK